MPDDCSCELCAPMFCDQCGKMLTESNCTLITGTCDNCLADQAAEDNYSYHNGEY